MTMTLTSSAFVEGSTLPEKYTCEGTDISPPLQWSGVPKEAKSLALIVDDPDAPDPAAPKITWVHWVLYNIPPNVTNFAEDIGSLPAGTCEGVNDWERTGYSGPCPPVGCHRYCFKLYALDTLFDIQSPPTKAQLAKAMQGRVLAEATLVATYQRHMS